MIIIILIIRLLSQRPRRSRPVPPAGPPQPRAYEPPMNWRTRFFLTRQSQRLLWSWLWEMYCEEFLVRFILFCLALVAGIVFLTVILVHLMPQ